jgi:hypothetical protein
MQSDTPTPQGSPRFQPINPGPKIATGYVDPCIVYLETTLRREVPLVAACWAAFSREVRELGKPEYLELNNVVVFKAKPHRRMDGTSYWLVTERREKSLTLKHGTTGRSASLSYFSPFQSTPPPVFQWAIRHLDEATDASLRKSLEIPLSPNSRQPSVARKLFELAKLDWPSIQEIVASLEKQEARRVRPRKSSFVDRLVSSVFRKKSKLAHA